MTKVKVKLDTTADLRKFLLESMVKTANGDISAPTAKAVCNYAQQIYNTLNIEMKFAQARAKLGDVQVEPVDFTAK